MLLKWFVLSYKTLVFEFHLYLFQPGSCSCDGGSCFKHGPSYKSTFHKLHSNVSNGYIQEPLPLMASGRAENVDFVCLLLFLSNETEVIFKNFK